MNDEQHYVMSKLNKLGYALGWTPEKVGSFVEIALEAIADYTEETEPYAIQTIRRLRETASTVSMSMEGG